MQKHHLWQATLERLRMSIDPDIFRLWFQETTALSWHEGVFVMGVANDLYKSSPGSALP